MRNKKLNEEEFRNYLQDILIDCEFSNIYFGDEQKDMWHTGRYIMYLYSEDVKENLGYIIYEEDYKDDKTYYTILENAIKYKLEDLQEE